MLIFVDKLCMIICALSTIQISQCLDRLSPHLVGQCLEFMAGSTSDFARFRLISREHHDICRDLVRRKFENFQQLFNSTMKQKRLKSWGDMVRETLMVPEMYFKFHSGNSGYYRLHHLHQLAKKSIMYGLCANRKLPFLSFLLRTNTTSGYWYTILICIFDRNQLRREFIYDELRQPRILNLKMHDLDLLLDRHSVRFQGRKGRYENDGWMNRLCQRDWQLIDEFVVEQPQPLGPSSRLSYYKFPDPNGSVSIRHSDQQVESPCCKPPQSLACAIVSGSAILVLIAVGVASLTTGDWIKV